MSSESTANGGQESQEKGAELEKKQRQRLLTIESYGLVFLAITVAVFYLFWIFLFAVGSTRVSHQ
jgi:hypothetical protein